MRTRPSVTIALAMFCANVAQGADAPAGRGEFQTAYTQLLTASTEKPNDSQTLREYVLFPYLQQKRIQLSLDVANSDWAIVDQAAADFLKSHGVEPITRDLRRNWYASLAKRGEWERYLGNYREVDDLALRCHALTARIQLEKFEGLAPMAVQLWSAANGSVPACEIPFNWLKTQSVWTPALIEKRARAALSAENPSFARQMIALMPKDSVASLESWAALIERPLAAIEAAIADPTKIIEPPALLDGWIRLARSVPDAAMQRYDRLVKARKLDAATASRFALEVALPLSWNRRSEALIYFAKVRPTEFDDRGWEWYGRSLIWNGEWKLAIKVFGSMPESLRKQTRWRYWLARATSLTGSDAAAQTQLSALLHDDNFYAALAAARLNKPYEPEQRSIDADEARLQQLSVEPPFQRAYELLNIGIRELRADAYDEWRFGYNKLGAEARVQAVVLAGRWGWYDQAILIASEQRLFNDYRLLYPRPFDEEVQAAAKITGLPPSIIYAMLRQESIFQIDAVSTANARGLMQLLPEVATRTARRWKLPPPGDLFDPRTNIPIGAAHLKDIYSRFDGQSILAFAAYNAGPNAAIRWLPEKPKDIDVWIEILPYNETRTYVQRVLWHSIVFGWLAEGKPQDSMGWLTTVSAEK